MRRYVTFFMIIGSVMVISNFFVFHQIADAWSLNGLVEKTVSTVVDEIANSGKTTESSASKQSKDQTETTIESTSGSSDNGSSDNKKNRYTKEWYFENLKKQNYDLAKKGLVKIAYFSIKDESGYGEKGLNKFLIDIFINSYGLNNSKSYNRYQLFSITDLVKDIDRYYYAKFSGNDASSTNRLYDALENSLKRAKSTYWEKWPSELKKSAILFIDDHDKVSEKMYRKVFELRNSYWAKKKAEENERIRLAKQAKQEEMARMEKQRQDQIEQIERELEKEKYLRSQHIKLIREGKRKIKTLDDASIFYHAKNGRTIVTHPPLKWVYPGFSKQNGYTLQLQSREIFRARMGN